MEVKFNLTEFTLLIIIVGVVVSIGATIMINYQDSVTEYETLSESDSILIANGSTSTLSQTPIDGTFSAISKNRTWLDFDGSNDWINMSAGGGLIYPNEIQQGYFTVCAWVNSSNFRNDNQHNEIFHLANASSNNDFGLILNSQSSGPANITIFQVHNENGYQRIEWCDGPCTSGDDNMAYEMNRWMFFCGMYNGTSIGLYKNGTLVEQADFNGTRGTMMADEFSIGSDNDGNKYNFNGSIDEVRIYNTSLSASEISAIYQAGRSQNNTPLNNTILSTTSDTSLIDNATSDNFLGTIETWNNASVKNRTWLSFDKDESYIQCPDNIPDLGSNLSVSIWVNITGEISSSSIRDNPIIGSAPYNALSTSQWRFELDYQGNISADIGSNCGSDFEFINPHLNDTKLHHLVFVITPINSSVADAYFYLDNELNQTITNFSWDGGCNPPYGINLGSKSPDPEDSLNGTIDEIRIYNKNLTRNEISQIYNSGITKNLSLPSDKLILYYPLEENQGEDLHNTSNSGSTTSSNCMNGNSKWANDGIDNLLTENTDYTRTDDAITLINADYSYSQITMNYDYYSLNDANQVLYLPLNENSGTDVHDIANGDTYSSTISGAIWNNDGIDNTLVENTDYTLSGTTFTLINYLLSWNNVNTSYSYSSLLSTKPDYTLSGNTASSLSEFGNWFSILVIIGVAGVVIFLIFTINGRNNNEVNIGGTY